MTGEDIDGASADEDRPEYEHLSDVDDGCGCTEMWSHLSEQRTADD